MDSHSLMPQELKESIVIPHNLIVVDHSKALKTENPSQVHCLRDSHMSILWVHRGDCKPLVDLRATEEAFSYLLNRALPGCEIDVHNPSCKCWCNSIIISKLEISVSTPV